MKTRDNRLTKGSKESGAIAGGNTAYSQGAQPPATPHAAPETTWTVITYTRKQALADRQQFDVTGLAKEAGFTCRVFITAAAWSAYVKVPDTVTGQDETGRLWDVVWMLRSAIPAAADNNKLVYGLYVRNADTAPVQLVTLKAEIGPVDFDDLEPAITIMLPTED